MKDATRCYVFQCSAADDLPCIGPATMDMGVEVQGGCWAKAVEFRDPRLMLQLGSHKGIWSSVWLKLNFGRRWSKFSCNREQTASGTLPPGNCNVETYAICIATSSIYFYNHVLRTLKPKGIDLDDFYRFFLVPGMQ